jgi:hypothetical protein
MPERDRRRAALPEAFRLRLDGFERARPDWRRDHEGYELFVCEEAAMLSTFFADKGLDALAAFQNAPFEEQRSTLPALRLDEHSGNTWGAACAFAATYIRHPGLVPKMHGAICPVVGCQVAGCFAARPEAKEG